MTTITDAEPAPEPYNLEEIIAKSIADASNVPFVGPKQRRAAAAVVDALKANRRATILTLRNNP